jgi:hypothetical protein
MKVAENEATLSRGVALQLQNKLQPLDKLAMVDRIPGGQLLNVAKLPLDGWQLRKILER